MKRIYALALALALLLLPQLCALAGSPDVYVSSYYWVNNEELDLYDLGFSIMLPAGWQVVDTDALARINEANSFASPKPYAFAGFYDPANDVQLLMYSEQPANPELYADSDAYLLQLVQQLKASGSQAYAGYEPDPARIVDAVLRSQVFRELAVYTDNGRAYDMLVCRSGMDTYYTITIEGTVEGITAFAKEFVTAVAEIEAVG